MKRRSISAGSLALLAAALLSGCRSENPLVQREATQQVVIRAAFTPLRYATVYDATGAAVATLSGAGVLAATLPEGTYYLDLADDQGNTAYGTEGNLRFAPAVDGAALDVEPHRLPGVDHPVVTLTVARPGRPAANHTMASEESARARYLWEEARAMVGPAAANTYQWTTTDTV